MNPNAVYYLHTNGQLIYKPHGIDDPNSTFIVKIWNASQIGKSPESFLDFVLDALKSGASKSECLRLYEHNKLQEFVPKQVDMVVRKKLHN